MPHRHDQSGAELVVGAAGSRVGCRSCVPGTMGLIIDYVNHMCIICTVSDKLCIQGVIFYY